MLPQMPETDLPPRLVRFGAFEADLRTGELRKDGVKLKFSGQPFQVLAILLERPGEVVTREELQKRLWPDTFVDVERNLNTAVNKIREVLGDSAETPRFVETLPRRGYRFIGKVEAPIQPARPVPAVEPVERPNRSRLWWGIGAGAFAIAVIALAAFVAYRWRRPQPPPEGAVLTAVPFTALPGWADAPAFSPDGSRIAFAWSPARGSNGFDQFDLYVKALGSETRLRLTQHPSKSLSPAWSPDGTQIAFYRRAGPDSGIYVVPALGGPEQKLRSTEDLEDATISWSPDGKWIAFQDGAPEEQQTRIFLLSMETTATRPIPVNPACAVESNPAFSHNGLYVAYWCLGSHGKAAIYSVPVPDGDPKMIAALIMTVPDGLAWSADDQKLVYSGWKITYSSELGEISVADGSVRQIGYDGIRPAVSSRGKLAYGSFSIPVKLWRRDLLHPEAPPLEFIPSSRPQYDAQYSPDGKRIVFDSLRSGVQGVWISGDDGSNLVQISDARSISGSPQWSPDGSKIAFDSMSRDSWEIYVADVAERKPRRVVTNVPSTIRPSWSRDGKWIYFVSHEAGREGVYRCPASGGDATLLSKDTDGLNPRESFDGKTVYFASGQLLKKMAVSAQPGTESEVDGALRVSNWALAPDGIYFVAPDAPKSVRYFDFAKQQVRTVFEANSALGYGLSASPDGRWILYSQEGDTTGDIMLVDHFR
jgi:Tol biopolymer transport system component/DNA-binding winged helix-turn-helix (wHTH) protein